MIEMKRRVESTPDGADESNVKMGPGAIRDAEWVVQQLQMMVGPTHPRARAKDTLRAIEVLSALNTLTHDEVRNLRESYLFLRTLEHRLQLPVLLWMVRWNRRCCNRFNLAGDWNTHSIPLHSGHMQALFTLFLK